MRKGITIAMTLLCIWMISTGLTALASPRIDAPAHHVVAAVLFLIALAIHVWLNRKPLLHYFKNLRWQWVLIGLGIVLIVATTIGH